MPHGHHILNNNANNMSLNASTGVYSTKHAQGAKHHRGSSVDALNNSVEMRGKVHHMAGGKTKHPRE